MLYITRVNKGVVLDSRTKRALRMLTVSLLTLEWRERAFHSAIARSKLSPSLYPSAPPYAHFK